MVQPQIQTLKEKLNTVSRCPVSSVDAVAGRDLSLIPPFSQVSMWVQLQIPKIEDGNNFGVAVQVSTGASGVWLTFCARSDPRLI